MLEIVIPGAEILRLDHLVTDFNGTLACDGVLLPGTSDALCRLAERLSLHVVTADTFGKTREALAGIPCELEILPPGDQDLAKLRYVVSGRKSPFFQKLAMPALRGGGGPE